MITNVQYILGLNFLSDTVVKKHLLNGQLSRKVVQLIYVGLIFKFQMIPPWIFHLGGGGVPPTARPLCPCDQYTRSNQCPYYQYVTMHITIS